MNNPFAPADAPFGDTLPSSAPAASPLPSLEALLAAAAPRPAPVPAMPPAPAQTPAAMEVLQAMPAREPACADLDAELLLVHAGTQESALAQTWMRRVLDGARLHTARFQDNLDEQVQLLLPHAVFIHFELPVLELAKRLVQQLRVSHPHLPLIAVGRMKNPEVTLGALRAGVQDFLDLDGAPQVAQKLVRELVSRSPGVAPEAQDSAPLTAVLSARAGLGTSLLTAHLAWYLQQRLAQGDDAPVSLLGPATGQDDEQTLQTLLLDLGSPGGDGSLYLDVGTGFDFIEAVQNLRRFDRRMVSSALLRHESGLRLLSLPPRTGELREVSYADADLLVLRLRQYFRHVVADLGAVQQSSLAARVAMRASTVWVVCDQSVASVVSTADLVRQLLEQKIDRSKIQLIVSRYDKRLELDAQQVARQLQLPLLAVIPERRLVLTQAVNQGQLLAPERHRDPYVQAVAQLADQLLRTHHPELAAPAAKRSLLGRLIPSLRS